MQQRNPESTTRSHPRIVFLVFPLMVLTVAACSDGVGTDEQVDLCTKYSLSRGDYASTNYGTIGPDRTLHSSVLLFRSPYKEIYAVESGHIYHYVDSLCGYYTMSSSDFFEVPVWINDPNLGGVTDVSWDGKRLLCVIGRFVVYTSDRDGSNRQYVFSYSGYMDFPYFSPDGKKIAVSTNERGLLLMNIDGSNVHELMTGRDVQWLPDNTMYLHTGGVQGADILSHLDTTGKVLGAVVLPGMKRYQLSPDAKWIAVNNIVQPYSEIYIYHIESGRKITLEHDSWGAYGWTSDSKYLVYHKWHPCIFTMDNGRLWVADLDGNKKQISFQP